MSVMRLGLRGPMPLRAFVPMQMCPITTRTLGAGGLLSRRLHARPDATRDVRRRVAKVQVTKPVDGPSTDLSVIYQRLWKLAMPYWTTSEVASQARWRLAGVVALTLATTGVSVMFNFLGRDFFNALSEKKADEFTVQLFRYLGGFVIGIPFFVFKSYFQSRLALEWRQWMTGQLLSEYMEDRKFYKIQNEAVVDNPDQRVSSDIAAFTETALGLSLTMLNAVLDLVSFSGILYTIYPPLFAALLIYSVGGTAISIALGKNLVSLNFNQEAREADFRYGLVRVRENAESIAFYQGQDDEKQLLQQRLQAAVENYMGLLINTRNLDFFTNFYRLLIQLVPAAVVAPLFFQGKIEFGVINQSQSAFNHVLNDLSLVVYQIEALAGFSAVVDRLGEFQEVMQPAARSESDTSSTVGSNGAEAMTAADAVSVPNELGEGGIVLRFPQNGAAAEASSSGALLRLDDVTVMTPRGGTVLVEGLTVEIQAGQSLLVMGPSGAGKTSVLRAAAGLWSTGSGTITWGAGQEDVMFLPQKPYMVLGTLRDQVLYPRCRAGLPPQGTETTSSNGNGSTYDAQAHSSSNGKANPVLPKDDEVLAVLQLVQLGQIVERYAAGGNGTTARSPLDYATDWSASLSLGEQQRLAWARLLLAKPRLALMDEATSALDQDTEALLYQVLAKSGIAYISVGHRQTLREFHTQQLQLQPQGRGTTGWQITDLTRASVIVSE